MTKNTFSCKECGGIMSYSPETKSLCCSYCDNKQKIENSTKNSQKLNYEENLNKLNTRTKMTEESIAKCNSCGATVSLEANEKSISCPFCETHLTTNSDKISLIAPSSIIPFSISEKDSNKNFHKWIKGLWFAPNKLKKALHAEAKQIEGIYVPYWNYDTLTHTTYQGERGDDYYTDEKTNDGETKSVRRTRWYKASGKITKFFNNILIIASNSLPKKQANLLEPWDLNFLTDYKESYLAGFRTEYYQIDLEEGFSKAKSFIYRKTEQLVKDDIGGDQQRIHDLQILYSDTQFNHILLPIWLSAFRYNNKVYRFLVNGQSGEIQGERPYSIPKIITAILVIISIITLIIYLNKHINS